MLAYQKCTGWYELIWFRFKIKQKKNIFFLSSFSQKFHTRKCSLTTLFPIIKRDIARHKMHQMIYHLRYRYLEFCSKMINKILQGLATNSWSDRFFCDHVRFFATKSRPLSGLYCNRQVKFQVNNNNKGCAAVLSFKSLSNMLLSAKQVWKCNFTSKIYSTIIWRKENVTTTATSGPVHRDFAIFFCLLCCGWSTKADHDRSDFWCVINCF